MKTRQIEIYRSGYRNSTSFNEPLVLLEVQTNSYQTAYKLGEALASLLSDDSETYYDNEYEEEKVYNYDANVIEVLP